MINYWLTINNINSLLCQSMSIKSLENNPNLIAIWIIIVLLYHIPAKELKKLIFQQFSCYVPC